MRSILDTRPKGAPGRDNPARPLVRAREGRTRRLAPGPHRPGTLRLARHFVPSLRRRLLGPSPTAVFPCASGPREPGLHSHLPVAQQFPDAGEEIGPLEANVADHRGKHFVKSVVLGNDQRLERVAANRFGGLRVL